MIIQQTDLYSKNKTKTIWNTVKFKTKKEVEKEGISLLNFNGALMDN
jgi:hypothetical protein